MAASTDSSEDHRAKIVDSAQMVSVALIGMR